MQPVALSVFREKTGLSLKDIRWLEKLGWIEVQQSGFKAHSLAHPKIVAVRDFDRLNVFLDRHFGFKSEEKEEAVPYKTIGKDATKKIKKEEPIFDFCGYLDYCLSFLEAEDITTLEEIESFHDFLGNIYVSGVDLTDYRIPALLREWETFYRPKEKEEV